MSDEFDLQAAFQSAAKLLGKDIFQIEAGFYPYAGLKSNIQLKGGKIFAKVSDGYEAASMGALTGLALDLMIKLFRIGHIGGNIDRYLEEFRKLNGKGVYELHESLRKARGRKRNNSAMGKSYDLSALMEKVLSDYGEIFSGMERPTILWSTHVSRRRLAFYDSAFNQVIVSKKFDSQNVPQFFLEYLIYHELLHAKHEIKYGKRRRVHHREFRADEKRFPHYEKAERLMKTL